MSGDDPSVGNEDSPQVIAFDDSSPDQVYTFHDAMEEDRSGKEFRDDVFESRGNLLNRMDKMNLGDKSSEKQLAYEDEKPETMAERKERLRKQREMILQKKKEKREIELVEYQSVMSERPGPSVQNQAVRAF